MSNSNKCFLWFIHNDFQKALKAKSKSERFEQTLKNYKDAFLHEFKSLGSSLENDVLKNTGLEDYQSLYKTVDELSSEFKKNIDEYRAFFDAVIYVYKLFISGKRYFATLYLKNILEEHDINDTVDIGLLYRGRTKKDNDNINQKKYYYHIPFNERYRARNERFSFSGQPILYLGSSIPEILFELRKTPNDFKSISISSYSHIPSNDIKPFKIFDLTNVLTKKLFENYFFIYSLKENLSKIMDKFHLPSSFNYKKDFKRYILMQLCTFPRSNDNFPFIEEYVLAQTLTESLSINGFDGVMYPSTQFMNKSINLPLYYSSLVLENLGLFAKYSSDSLYDESLINRFDIEILSKENLKLCHQDDILKLSEKLSISSITKFNTPTNHFLKSANRIDNIIQCKKTLTNNSALYNSDIEKAELYAQSKYLAKLVSEFKKVPN